MPEPQVEVLSARYCSGNCSPVWLDQIATVIHRYCSRIASMHNCFLRNTASRSCLLSSPDSPHHTPGDHAYRDYHSSHRGLLLPSTNTRFSDRPISGMDFGSPLRKFPDASFPFL